MGQQRAASFDKSRMRNLKQYKGMSDEQFNSLWEDKVMGVVQDAEFEKRIKRKMDDFAVDYDLGDMKVNDHISLRHLIQIMIKLEDLEQIDYANRKNGYDSSKLAENRELSQQMTLLRTDLSKIQTDLGITRKARKGDAEANAISEVEKLKSKAKEFYEQRLFYIFCPKCNTLLSTTWFLYPDSKHNKLQFVCERKTDDGGTCGEKFTVTSAELLERRGMNSDNVPEGLR